LRLNLFDDDATTAFERFHSGGFLLFCDYGGLEH
jgi:hypothetical protein